MLAKYRITFSAISKKHVRVRPQKKKIEVGNKFKGTLVYSYY